MKTIITMTITLLFAFSFTHCSKGEDFSLKVYSVIGDVSLISADGEKALKPGDGVKEGDTVKTSKLAIADLVQQDSVLIRIHENSVVRVAALLSKTNNDSQLTMDKGKMYVTLSRMKKGSFSVKTPTSVASVRGTAFRISSDNNASRLDVINGTVAVNPVKDSVIIKDVEKNIEANQCTSIDKKAVDAIITKKEIAVEPLKPETIKEIQAEVKDIKPEVLEKLNPDAKKEFSKNLSDAGKEKEAALQPEKNKAQAQQFNLKNRKDIRKKSPIIENRNKPATEKKEKDNSTSTPANIQTL